MSTIKRWDRLQRKYVDVSCPAIVEEYDEHMGGGDLFDMLMSLYRLHVARSQKLQVVLPKFLLGTQCCCYQWVAIVLPSHTAEECAGPRSFGFHSKHQWDSHFRVQTRSHTCSRISWSPSRSSDVEDTSAKGAEFVADSELEEPGTLLQKEEW